MTTFEIFSELEAGSNFSIKLKYVCVCVCVCITYNTTRFVKERDSSLTIFEFSAHRIVAISHIKMTVSY